MAKKVESAEEVTSLPANDAWTGMLVIAFLALSVGTGFLLWDYLQYHGQPLPTLQSYKPPPAKVVEPPKVQPAPEPKVEPKAE